ncbi:CLUMA_CG007398, isoform A [Clunio marinus]|uniref:CLUMA_CG007398, isoform A n=1 Tax=Clunio marinus TaxID=568069 RepID=A0A1J1I0J8_9DIPT|nr:CLUMA_CG007398, isoform A [Clunio marinus]
MFAPPPTFFAVKRNPKNFVKNADDAEKTRTKQEKKQYRTESFGVTHNSTYGIKNKMKSEQTAEIFFAFYIELNIYVKADYGAFFDMLDRIIRVPNQIEQE